MANQVIYGLVHRARGAQPPVFRRDRVLNANTNAISSGDAIVATTAGDVVRATAGGAVVSGAAVFCEYTDATGQRLVRNQLPANTTYSSTGNTPTNASYVYHADNGTEDEYLASVVSGTFGIGNLFANADLVLNAPTSHGYSGHRIATTLPDTTVGRPLRLLKYATFSGADTDAASPVMIVKLNTSQIEPALNNAGV